MYSVTPSFIGAGPRTWPPKRLACGPSERCHCDKMERGFPSLQELVVLIRLYKQHETGSQRDLLAVHDHDPAPFGHDELMVPLVAVHRGVAALSDDQLMHRGLPGAVLATDELFHPHVVTAFLQKANRGDRPDMGRVHAERPGKPAALLRFCAVRVASRIRPGLRRPPWRMHPGVRGMRRTSHSGFRGPSNRTR